uniref:type I restriction endonuclease subunit R, EcoR124 family n=1 Tax=Erysipelothrix piscisicarius TaxID=2485784 RepID=UPI00225DDBE4|nr:hypothetical protein [Erysipelothrix piscisicarius]
MNELTRDIEYLFDRAGIPNFEKLPEDLSERGQFAKLFSEFNKYLEAGKVQGFTWDKKFYSFEDGEEINIKMDEYIYLTLAQRYKELSEFVETGDSDGDLPFDIDGYLTEIDTGKIDTNYMNSRFEKYLRDLRQENIDPEEIQKTLNELHKSFASLSQEEQKFANIFLHDVERGEADLVEGKSFRDYITEYQLSAKNKQVIDLHNAIGLDMELLENKSGKKLPMFMVNRDISKLLREFILTGGFDIYEEE